MANLRMETIVCPQCNSAEAIRLWDEIDASKDITAKNKLISGDLFHYKCRKCGYKATTGYNCMYKDPSKNLMIYYAADGDISGMRMAMDKVDSEMNKLAPFVIKNTIKRCVNDPNSLQEKVIIFDAGLDDRIIELMKYFYVSAVMENDPSIQVQYCYFCIVDDAWRLEIGTTYGRAFAINMQKNLYDAFKDEYIEIIESDEEKYVIGANYAQRIFNIKTDNEQ